MSEANKSHEYLVEKRGSAANTESDSLKRVKLAPDAGTLAALNAAKWTGADKRQDATQASLDAATAAYIEARSGAEVKSCPYLDTINRRLLDFDFEKVCSVTLATTNIYACLVCGKYFQGRGKSSPAYTHTLETDHRVYVNLHTERFYCLPEGYIIEDPSLDDIRYNINPTYSKETVANLGPGGSLPVPGFEPGTRYVPGLMGLNNVKQNDWLNVVIQALSQVTPLRNFMLIHANTEAHKSSLVQSLGALFRKIWSPRAFKSHVSPHVFMQVVSDASERRFKPGVQCDVAQFLVWLLNQLHRDLGGTAKRGSSIIHTIFQGEFRTETTKALAVASQSDTTHTMGLEDEEPDVESKTSESKTVVQHVPFLILPIQLPFAPVFAEAKTRSFIHQVKLMDLLEKFSGDVAEELPNGDRRMMMISKLPNYLWVHVKRFSTNEFKTEKNNTLVTFPLENLSLERCVYRASLPSESELASLPVADLLARRTALLRGKAAQRQGQPVEKGELVKEIRQLMENSMDRVRKCGYSLVANIVHEGNDIAQGSYYCHILNRATGTWYEARDLSVTSPEGLAQLVALSQTYIQLYELKASQD